MPLCKKVELEEVNFASFVIGFKSYFSQQVQRCLSSGDAPAACDAPAGSKALARVLGAVPQAKCKENNFRSTPDFPEPEESVNKDSCSPQPNTHASCTTTGKTQHCHLRILYVHAMIEGCILTKYIFK